MRSLLALLVLVGLAVPALAAEKGPAEGGAPGTNVDMPYLMAPLTDTDGNLEGYAYVSSRLTATSAAGALEVRDRIAFIQDAFIRDVNATSVAAAGDPPKLDNPALEARLLADARRIMGKGKVASIAITQVQVAPLHPSAETPAAAPPEPVTAPAEPAKSAASP
jgi:hypothetical protein